MRWHVSQSLKSIADFFDQTKAIEYAKTQGENVLVRGKTTGETVYDSEKEKG